MILDTNTDTDNVIKAVRESRSVWKRNGTHVALTISNDHCVVHEDSEISIEDDKVSKHGMTGRDGYKSG